MTDQDGLNQKVIDMGEAVAQLKTDMEWVKSMLKDIKEKLDRQGIELEGVVSRYQAQVERRLEEHEERIENLERWRSWFKGALAGLGAVSTLLAVVEIAHLLGW